MAEKPKKLQEILPEEIVIESFGIKEPESGKFGKSRILSGWIRQGLKYFELSDKRYFLETDLLDFLWSEYRTKYHGSQNEK